MSAAAESIDLGAAVHAAMSELPPHALLAQQLLEARTGADRAALLDGADRPTLEGALAFAAQPENTRERDRRLAWLRADPRRIAALRAFYAAHIAEFISNWMTVSDPRRAAKGQSALMAFELWPKQRELVEFIIARVDRGEPGTVVKSRDVGASSVCLATFAALCIFRPGFCAGVLSATEQKLDRYPDTLFDKLRGLLRFVPPEFAAGYDEARTSGYLKIWFPETGSSIAGATGSNAFRGLRLSVVMTDESAHLQDGQAIDAALAAVSDARIDVSTPNGIGGQFFQRAHNAAIPRIDLTWRDDPRRDQAWYDRQAAMLDPVVLAQEVNADFSASREGVVIPAAWVQSAIGLAERLGIVPSGARYGALDLGDTADKSALAIRHGVALQHLESWSGAASDLAKTAARAFDICDGHGIRELLYDGDGLGASMRGDARMLNEQRRQNPAAGRLPITVVEYRGSASPEFPQRLAPRTNVRWGDFVANRKAQAWMCLRSLFEQAHRAASGEEYDDAGIISIDPKLPELARLMAELSQPTMSTNATGKILIDKLGDGERSPNLADAVCMVYAPRLMPMRISDAVFDELAAAGMRGPFI